MYASFQSLSEREAKRKALLREAQKDASIRNHLEERYKDALWAGDKLSRISMFPTRTSSSIQTDASIPADATVKSVSFATNTEASEASKASEEVKSSTAEEASDRVFSSDESMASQEFDNEENLKQLQEEARSQVNCILSDPAASDLPMLHPIFVPPHENKSQSYLIGAKGFLYHTKSRKKVRKDIEKKLESEIDWLVTLNHVNSKLQGYADLQALRTRNQLRKGVASLKENVKDKYADVITDQSFNDDHANDLNLKRNVFDILKQPYELKQATIEANSFKNSQDQKIYKNALNTILTMNREASNKIKISPFERRRKNIGEASSVLPEAYELNPLTLELKHNGEVLSSERANEIVSWENTLRNFLTIAGANKLQLNIPKELNIQYYAADRKHRLDDSTISNAPDASRPRTEDQFETKIKFIYINNPFLLEIAPISPVGIDGYEQDYVFGEEGKLLKRLTNEELKGEDLNKARASILWGPTYQDLVNELIDGKNWLEEQPRLTPDRVEILNNFNRTLKALGVKTTMKLIAGKGLKGAGVARMTKAGYNLRDIEGTGMASDLIYKRLGSKFVQVEKLNDLELKIVYPNRKTVGKRRSISPEVAEMIKTLIYDKTIDQD